MLRRIHTILLAATVCFSATSLLAHVPGIGAGAPTTGQSNTSKSLGYRIDCAPGLRTTDQDVNNVRGKLTTGGDVWWNGNDAGYIVPKVALGETQVSSLFAGAVWLGGLDPAGNLKVAAQDYGRSRGEFDFYPGPLDPDTGEVPQEVCSQWDKFFEVSAAEIREHQRLFAASLRGEINYTDDMIPDGVKAWPGKGNPYFREVHGFAPPNNNQGLAGFYDYCDDDGNCNLDGLYDPLSGDFPIIEIEGCEDYYNPNEDLRDSPQFPDEMIFWIYNDNGNSHLNSGSDVPLQMEVQVQAFAYATNDALNNMTFQRYKLINRGKEVLENTFFGIWIDGDLGCFTDDYIGCDTTRSLAYYYNSDAVDGSTGTICQGGVPTYGTEVPLMGVDYFRGPKEFITIFDTIEMDSIVVPRELPMSSFVYFNNASVSPIPLPQTTDPTPGIAAEYYNYLQGIWKDGTPYTVGGDGYQTAGAETKFVFPSVPSDESAGAWSMCSEGLPEGDRRTIQASGPFDLTPGAVNELIIGIPWIANELTYPCPIMTRLFEADDLAQNLFDNCFDLTDGPDAPDIDFIELDQQLTILLTNDPEVSNNAGQEYAEIDLLAPDGVSDSLYRFEGYKVYQLRNSSVSLANLNDPSVARLIFQSDVVNGVGEIYNWNAITNPLDPEAPVFEPVPQVQSSSTDQGTRTVLRVTEDQFSQGAPGLVNHKPYYFAAVAYAYNNYADFQALVVGGSGQRTPYLEGRNNVRIYTGVPRPITDVKLNGDGTAGIVRRLDGEGTGPFFLDLAEGEYDRLLNDQDNNQPLYQAGRAPISVETYNPFVTEDGVYTVIFDDSDTTDDVLDADGTWRLLDANGTIIVEDNSFDSFNELIIGELGIAISLGQAVEPGVELEGDNGCIGYEVQPLETDGEPWFQPIPNKTPLQGLFGGAQVFNFMLTDISERDEPSNAFALDPNQSLTDCFQGQWAPFALAAPSNIFSDPVQQNGIGFITPMLRVRGSSLVSDLDLADLNNVDVVFTSDKSKWSRCVIVETANSDFTLTGGIDTEGDAAQFDLRQAPSVSKDADANGLPIPDGSGTVGMGWFPGYAIDVETGQRLNIFFGENSAITYDGDPLTNPYRFEFVNDAGEEIIPLTGRDMMFNPTGDIVQLTSLQAQLYNVPAGGHHMVYVTREPYDECAQLFTLLENGRNSLTREALESVTYASIVTSAAPFLSYADGLIPQDVAVKLRVSNPYSVSVGKDPDDPEDRYFSAPTGENDGHPMYEFTLSGVAPEPVPVSKGDSILSFINVVPNPYYGYSEYEISEFSNLIRITNLPAQCDVTIYALDGRFIRQYKRAEETALPSFNPDDPRLAGRAIESQQIYPDLDWDMKNAQGIPVSSGIYLIHVDAGELGQRTVKSFILQRAFDPAGL